MNFICVFRSLTLNGSAPTNSKDKLLNLRSLMIKHKIDAYIIPSVDAHQVRLN